VADAGGPLWRAWQLIFGRLPDVLAFDGAPHRARLFAGTSLLALVVLIGMGLSWLLRRRHGDAPPRSDRAATAPLIGAAAVIGLHLLLCVFSDFDVHALQDRYLMPAAPFAFLLACTAGSIPLRPDRGRWRIPLALAAAALSLGLCATQLARFSVPSGPLHVESLLEGSRFTPPLRSHLESLSPEQRVELAEDHPHDRFDILRTHGEAASVSALSGDPGAWARSLQARSVDVHPPARAPFWEGAGRFLHSELFLPGLVSVGSYVDPGPSDPQHRIHLLFGLGDGTLDHAPGELTSTLILVARQLPDEDLPYVCAGVGARLMHHRYSLLEQPPPFFVLERCREDWLAVGMGMQLARETLPGTAWPPDEPRLDWWVPQDVASIAQDAFVCGYERERWGLVAIADEGWGEGDEPRSALVVCLEG